MKHQAVRQVQTPGFKFNRKIASQGLNDRWFADLIDFTAAQSDGGEWTGLQEARVARTYILVVLDVFSRPQMG